ncbi:MAG TPA: ASKHA domain-containing protein, partial [Smithellaceae bacterium]|nr:ASKHA domain-containing protein [Smithellaceae bacterium]
EAATIRHGMQAVSGAIAAVSIDRVGDRVICSVIPQSSGADCLPSGICGSGVVSAVAELYRTGLLSGNGLLVNPTGSSLIRRDKAGLLEFELAGASQSQTQRPITLTQTDIRAVQLAKGALFTGMKMLCAEAGITSLERLLVAGAFGNFLDIKAALMIGMFPDLPEDCIAMVGNAAATGAALLLFKPELRDQARNLARSVKVLDLAARPDFQDLFLRSLAFPAWTS